MGCHGTQCIVMILKKNQKWKKKNQLLYYWISLFLIYVYVYHIYIYIYEQQISYTSMQKQEKEKQ